jgi:hypothetical protein
MNLSVARLSSLAVQRRGRHRVGASRLHPMSLRRHRPLQRLYGVAASATRVASIGSPRAAWARAMGAGGILGGAPGAGVVILCQEGGTASVASRRGGDCLRDPGRRDGDAVRRASARGECGTRRRGTVVTCFGKNGRRDSRRGDRRTGRGGGNACFGGGRAGAWLAGAWRVGKRRFQSVLDFPARAPRSTGPGIFPPLDTQPRDLLASPLAKGGAAPRELPKVLHGSGGVTARAAEDGSPGKLSLVRCITYLHQRSQVVNDA